MTQPKPDITYRKQIEGVEGARPASLPGVCLAVLGAAAAMLLLGSKDLLAWVNNLPIGPVSDYALLVAQTWHDDMIRLRVTGYSETINALLAALQALRWR
jgi:hypothetical protein